MSRVQYTSNERTPKQLFSRCEEELIQYNKDVAQTLNIDFQKVMKSEPGAAKQFMTAASFDDIHRFFSFIQSVGADINRFYFFNNFFTRFPGGQFWESITKEDPHPDIQRMLTESIIQVDPHIICEDGKSSKYANQSLSAFHSDITQAMSSHDIDTQEVYTLVEKRGISMLESKEKDEKLHKLLLPVYYTLRKQGYNYIDLCD